MRARDVGLVAGAPAQINRAPRTYPRRGHRIYPSYPRSPGKRADYRAAQAGLEAAQQGVALEKAKKWEDIELGLTAEHSREEDAPDGFVRETMLGFKVKAK